MQDIKAFEPLWGEWYSVEPLGQGSFGKVYKMVKKDLDKEYYAAVKHLSLPNEPGEEKNLYAEGIVTDNETLKTYYDDVLKTLCSEIDLCYKLKGNTNIVSYEDHYIRPKDSGVGYDIFIKMELLTGLKDRIKEGGLTVPDVVKLGEDICRALTVLRREKIVHRDIKPDNIFVNSGGDYKLGDFGVSKTLERTVSSMTVAGTFKYMAPELRFGGTGDYRVDIYSLGLVLYRMLNRKRAPFLPPPPASVDKELYEKAEERRFQGDPLPPPVEADEELSKIILKACAYRAEDRWSSAEEMGKALKEYRQRVEGTVPHPKKRRRPQSSPDPKANPDPEPAGGTEIIREPDPEPAGGTEIIREPDPEPAGGTEIIREPDPEPAGGTEIIRGPDPEPAGGAEIIRESDPDDPNGTRRLRPSTRWLISTKKESPEKKDRVELKPPTPEPPHPDDKDAGIKAKLTGGKIIAGAAVAAILIGVIGVSFLGKQSAVSDKTATASPDPTVSVASPPLETDASEQILWQDSFIRDGVLSTLGIDEDELTLELLAEIEELRLSVAEPDEPESPAPVSTLADLSMLTGLKTLDLSGHPIKKYDFPEDTPSLETLKIARCGCDSAEFLTQPCFEGLRELDLSGNAITDLSPLSGLSELANLNISQTPVTSLEPLSGLTGLAALSAAEVPAEDWSFVEQIANVEGHPEPSAEPEATPTPRPTSDPTPRPTQRPAATTPVSNPTVISVSTVWVSPSEVLLGEGGAVRLSVSVSPANATNQSVSWSSSNPSVAVVDGSGYVSAVGRGTARITATCDGKFGFCTITVD